MRTAASLSEDDLDTIFVALSALAPHCPWGSSTSLGYLLDDHLGRLGFTETERTQSVRDVVELLAARHPDDLRLIDEVRDYLGEKFAALRKPTETVATFDRRVRANTRRFRTVAHNERRAKLLPRARQEVATTAGIAAANAAVHSSLAAYVEAARVHSAAEWDYTEALLAHEEAIGLPAAKAELRRHLAFESAVRHLQSALTEAIATPGSARAPIVAETTALQATRTAERTAIQARINALEATTPPPRLAALRAHRDRAASAATAACVALHQARIDAADVLDREATVIADRLLALEDQGL